MEENQNTLVTEEVNETPSKEGNSAIDRFFGISKHGSNFRTEIIAGIVTFLSMCYILTLNPTIITGGNQLWGSVFIATAIGAVIGTLLMALLAKMPLCQAPGLGLNTMVATAMAGFLVSGKTFSFGNVMVLVLISGVIFLLLSIIPYRRDKETGRLIAIREAIFTGMPKQLRASISVGIGFFITIIGLVNSGIIGSADGTTYFTTIDLVPFNNADLWKHGGVAASACVLLFGLIVIAILSHYKVKGSVIIGILAATILACPLGVAHIKDLKGTANVSWKFWKNFENFFSLKESKGGSFGVVFTEGFKDWPKNCAFGAIVVVITFCMIDMFDTMGTVVGCATSAGLVDEDGVPHNYNKIMIADSVATVAGAVLGTSTVTTFIESGSGIAAGGRTGLVSLTAAVLFLLSIFVMPVFAFIPSSACACALVYVGVLMLGNIRKIDFTDTKTIVPAFLTIVMMPFGYSITDGIGIGVISYVLIVSVCWVIDIILYKAGKREEKPKFEVSIVLLVIFALFLVYFLVPTSV